MKIMSLHLIQKNSTYQILVKSIKNKIIRRKKIKNDL
jgi:hypothetical protein